jgi:hypothetical protein
MSAFRSIGNALKSGNAISYLRGNPKEFQDILGISINAGLPQGNTAAEIVRAKKEDRDVDLKSVLANIATSIAASIFRGGYRKTQPAQAPASPAAQPSPAPPTAPKQPVGLPAEQVAVGPEKVLAPQVPASTPPLPSGELHATAKRMPGELGYEGQEQAIAQNPAFRRPGKTLDEIKADNPEVVPLFDALSKKGAVPLSEIAEKFSAAEKVTGGARLLRLWRELYNTSPEGTAILTELMAKKKGATIPEPALSKIRDAAERQIAGRKQVADLTDAYNANPSAEGKAAVLAAEKAAYQAERELAILQHKYVPMSPWDVLTQSMRMGVMKPVSLIANVWGNTVVRATGEAPSHALAAGIDKLRSAITGKPRAVVSSVGALKAEKDAFVKSLRSEIPDIYKHGFSEEQAKQGEQMRGLHPIEAVRQLKGNEFAVDPNTGKALKSDKLARWLEAILGGQTEAIGRSLAAGDVPFKRSARAKLLAEQGKILKIPPEQVESYLAKHDPERLAALDREALAMVYQEPNLVARIVGDMWRSIRGAPGGGAAEYAMRASGVGPMFVQTPVNVAKQLSVYALGPASVVRGATQVARGNTRAGELNMARGLVGSMYHLAALGILSLAPAAITGPPSKNQKERELQYAGPGPYKLNVTALKRAMSGGSSEPQDGDVWIDYAKAGWLGGVLAIDKAVWDQNQERLAEGETPTVLWDMALAPVLETGRFALNQTFAQGTALMLDALVSGEPAKINQWTKNIERALLSTVVPATLEDVGKIGRKNMPEKRSSEPSISFQNVLKERFNWAGAAQDIPPRRGLFGEPVAQTPEGSNPLVYHMVDVFKARVGPIPEYYRQIDALYRRTYDQRAIPTIPRRTIERGGKQYALDDAQWDAYQEMVGQLRLKRIQAAGALYRGTDQQKLETLAKIYEQSAEYATTQFLAKYGSQLKWKPTKERPSNRQGAGDSFRISGGLDMKL